MIYRDSFTTNHWEELTNAKTGSQPALQKKQIHTNDEISEKQITKDDFKLEKKYQLKK